MMGQSQGYGQPPQQPQQQHAVNPRTNPTQTAEVLALARSALLNEYPEFTDQFDRAPAQMQETLLTT